MELKKRIVNWRKYMTPTREQVEKVWKGGQEKDVTMRYICKLCGCVTIEEIDFCPYCGAAHTEKAVNIIMKRLEALYEQTKAD